MKWHAAVVVLFITCPLARGAYFDYYAGGVSAFCEVYAEDLDEMSGPFSDSNEALSSTELEQYAEVTDAYSYAFSTIYDFNLPEYNSVCIRANSYVEALAIEPDCNVICYGYGATRNEPNYGIYYRIAPGAGEQIGDYVLVHVSLTIDVSAWGSDGYVYIGGPGVLSHISITKGLLPPVLADPDPAYEVWAVDNLEAVGEAFDAYTGIDSFEARIGDVIGIFIENYADVTAPGILDEVLESDLAIVLTAKTILRGDMDGDGDVDSFDFAILAGNWLSGTQ